MWRFFSVSCVFFRLCTQYKWYSDSRKEVERKKKLAIIIQRTRNVSAKQRKGLKLKQKEVKRVENKIECEEWTGAELSIWIFCCTWACSRYSAPNCASAMAMATPATALRIIWLRITWRTKTMRSEVSSSIFTHPTRTKKCDPTNKVNSESSIRSTELESGWGGQEVSHKKRQRTRKNVSHRRSPKEKRRRNEDTQKNHR